MCCTSWLTETNFLYFFSVSLLHLFVAAQKTGGQELVGGLDCVVHRNFFGSQVNTASFLFQLIVYSQEDDYMYKNCYKLFVPKACRLFYITNNAK